MTIAYSSHKVKSSLKYSILDGAAWAAMTGLTVNYITPFALALKASTTEIGLLSSIPNLTMALSQLSAPNLSAKAGSRLKLILPVVFVHALTWIPIMLVPYFFPSPQVMWLIVLVTVNTVLGSIANPAWGSMMADLVPSKVRGRYFANRGRIMGLITLIASLMAGGILQIFTNNIFTGFCIIFAGATAFRLISCYYLSRMYEPPMEAVKSDSPNLWQMFLHLGSSNLGKFTIYAALINFATMISGPYFAVFMLRDLHFSYSIYMVIISTNAVSTMLFQTFWGRRADLAGNFKVLKFTSFILPVLPFFYIITDKVPLLIPFEVVSGFAWSGFNLAAANFVYDASVPEIRTKQIAMYNAILGLAICFGAILGGYLAPLLPYFAGYQLRSVFAISGGLRALIVIFMLHCIVEVRNVPQVNWLQFLRGRLNPEAMRKVVYISNKNR